MTNELMHGSWSRGYKYPEWRLGQRGSTGLGWSAWVGRPGPISSQPTASFARPGPISAQPTASFVRCRFSSLLDPSPFCTWALVVSFSPNWMKLLVPQDSTLFWLGPRSFSSSQVWSLGFLESCSLHCLTCTGLKGLVMRCLMNLSRKSSFQH
jgi:hypothetical protein